MRKKIGKWDKNFVRGRFFGKVFNDFTRGLNGSSHLLLVAVELFDMSYMIKVD